MTLRARLAWTFGATVALAVAFVAIVSYVAIDRTMRSALDARLGTTAAAVAALVDVHHGRLNFDREDREQMLLALGAVMDAAIFRPDGALFVSSGAPLPGAVVTALHAGVPLLHATSFRHDEHTFRGLCKAVTRGTTAYGYVCTWQNADFIGDVDRDVLLGIALAAAIAGGIAIVLSSTVARRALAPLEAFTDLATEIEAHDLSRRVRRSGDDELGRLGAAFDRMLDRLESAFARQRRFTADASHELRAPLAVIRAEADAALQRERAPGEYQAALQIVVGEVERIDALVDALLLAARADSARLHFAPAGLDELAELAVERFGGAAAQRGVVLEQRGEPVTLLADVPALERALAAILHNAIGFAVSRVTVSTGQREGRAWIEVRDDGPGFSPAGLVHATERFWREGERREGTGLGLAIAEAIVRAHGGVLELENARPGARVRMAFIVPSSSDGKMP